MNETNLQKLQENTLVPGMAKLKLDVKFAVPVWQYLNLLAKWNQAYNLTAIRDLGGMVVQHALDGLSVHSYIAKTDHRLIDVGTGGGVPGVLLAIVRPDLEVFLLDAVGKKARFLRQVKRAMQLDNVTVIHDRVENYSPGQKFDVVISRAFSEVNQFLKWTDHLGDAQSRFLAMKGPRNETLEMESRFLMIQEDDLKVPFLNEQRKLYQYKKAHE
ncbi:16S rRNA (guanine(527)-N(7))-methyltransferase RsmG [Marinicella rhabdoformis]|uniref:16S rRNA (guanine(527)-N(7))-methyltransferase RsmG n=1 Tax=Marinicella rhabdoformis TaxID=2580566 RepID=UPI0012AEC3F5|nr:16S rRNA (guanine(527)-N(7))-methyltransferase RsmG [Marinicella rhabdoformis]